MGMPMPGLVPYVIIGVEPRGVERHRGVVARAVVGAQRPPPRDGRVPARALRRELAPLEPVEGASSGAIMPGARARLDGHVAEGHPLLHVERRDRRAAVLEDVAGRAADADLRDEREDHVLGADARRQRAVDADLQRLRLALQQALRREHVLDLARADAERERAERAVRRGVAVAADDRHARLREAELRPDDVDDALLGRVERVERTPNSAQFFASGPSCARACASTTARAAARVGVEWSIVAKVRSGRRTAARAREAPRTPAAR